jgi:hypothetical protein
MHELTGVPSIHTVHALHAPRSHTTFVPVRSRFTRSASASVVRGSIVAGFSAPLIYSLI